MTWAAPVPPLRPADRDRLLAVIRLGDADMLNWWRSHSVDETAEYVLGQAFPTTWLATGLELAMESSRLRHEAALERPIGSAPAIHIWSDHLPFHQLLRSWLVECKLEQDFTALEWTRDVDTKALSARIGGRVEGERRGSGLYLGEVRQDDLTSEEELQRIIAQLAGAYASVGPEFCAPYYDLVTDA